MQASIAAGLAEYASGSRVWLAYSGGVDSTLMLALCAPVCTKLGLTLSAIHVHHGVAEQADQWVEHCQQFCQSLQVPLQVQYLPAFSSTKPSTHPTTQPTTKPSENDLRQARYGALLQPMAAGEPLLLAHHQQDQAETVLLRLCRGTSAYGLQAMQAKRQYTQDAQNRTHPLNVCLLRPWLGFSREQIMACAQQLQLCWIEDPSNQQLSWRRNFMRHQVLPLLAQQWPAATQQIAQLAQLAQQQQTALAWLLQPYLQKVCLTPSVLSLPELMQLPVEVQRLVVAHWIRGLMGELVSQTWLHALLTQQSGQYGHFHFHRFQQGLWCVDTRHYVAAQLTDWQAQLTGLSMKLRQGGERIFRAANRPHQTLKNLFQAQQVPPWLRDSWPLLYQDEQLVLIPHLWVHEDFRQKHRAPIEWLHPGVMQWLEWRRAVQATVSPMN